MTGTKRRLTGRIRVPLPPGEAFHLFTPRGEGDWAPGWDPYFPVPTADDTEPGTAFETSSHGRRTLWLVTSREWARRISYARVTPDDRVGTVDVTIDPVGDHSEVEVTYTLTALGPAADHDLQQFADGYDAYLRSWQDAILVHLSHRGHQTS